MATTPKATAKTKAAPKKKVTPKKEKPVIINGKLMVSMSRNHETGRNNPIAAHEIWQAKEAVSKEKKATGFHILTTPFNTRSERRKSRMVNRAGYINNRPLTKGRIIARQLSGLLTLPKRVISYLSKIGKRASVIFAS